MAQPVLIHRLASVVSRLASFDVTPKAQAVLPACSAYKNVLNTQDHRMTFLEFSILNKMEQQARNRIERILDQVNSLDDLSTDDIVELRRVSESSIIIDKFRVSPAQYYGWVEKFHDGIRGVEFDAQNACLVVKGGPGPMHETATCLIGTTLFRDLEDTLSKATGLDYDLTGSTDYLLSGKFDGSSKQADASLKEPEAEYPVVVLEVGLSETTRKLHNDAERWLEGSQGQTKLVILVNVEETERRNTSNDKWDLSEIDVQQMHYRTLSRRIFQWYRSKGIRLFGSFELSVLLWYSDGVKQSILEKATFSPDNLIDPTTVEDVPLRLEYLLPDLNPSDEHQRILFPLQRLVRKLQSGFTNIEIHRAGLLAKEQKRSH